MTRKQFRLSKGHGVLTLALLLTLALFVDTGAGAVSASSDAISIPAAVPVTALIAIPAPKAPPPLQAQSPNGKIDCTAIYVAKLDLSLALLQVVNLTPATDYDRLADPASPVYLDFAQLHADLSLLAALPDSAGHGRLQSAALNESIAYFRQLVDIAEHDVKAHGQPFQDTNAAGQKVIGEGSMWLQQLRLLSAAVNAACPGFVLTADGVDATAVAVTATPETPESTRPLRR